MLFFGAHMANWELPGLITIAHGIDFAGIYRALDSAVFDEFVAKLRGGFMKLIPASSARRCISTTLWPTAQASECL